MNHRLKETVSIRYDDDQVLEWQRVTVSRTACSNN